jgi:hypothetical protein
MATIKTRKKTNGQTRYTAIVRIRQGNTITHRESKTFTFRAAAISWARQREVALEDPAELPHARESDSQLSILIRWYINNFQKISKWERTKQSPREHPDERHRSVCS